ncbi:hypothetical protein HMPREF1869_00205 [Bacteroidales bacterium KA00251]|nr:hypothetical protein HMPREF1869_00205 [Bacteroidales bacterium KA00251]
MLFYDRERNFYVAFQKVVCINSLSRSLPFKVFYCKRRLFSIKL